MKDEPLSMYTREKERHKRMTALEEQRKAANKKKGQELHCPEIYSSCVGIGSIVVHNLSLPKSHKKWLLGQAKVRLEEVGCKVREISSSWQSELHCIFTILVDQAQPIRCSPEEKLR